MPVRILLTCLIVSGTAFSREGAPAPPLQGGVEMVLVVDPSGEDRKAAADEAGEETRPARPIEELTRRAKEIAAYRLRLGGCQKADARVQGKDHIVATLPEVNPGETENWKSILRTTGRFELRLVATESDMDEWREPPKAPKGFVWLPFKTPRKDRPHLLCENKPVVGNEDVVRAVAERVGRGLADTGEEVTWYVLFDLSEEAGKRFGDCTNKNVHRRLAIVIDGVVRSAPVIRSRMDREAVIQGNFSEAEAKALALSLRAGAYPCRVEVESVTSRRGDAGKGAQGNTQ